LHGCSNSIASCHLYKPEVANTISPAIFIGEEAILGWLKPQKKVKNPAAGQWEKKKATTLVSSLKAGLCLLLHP